MIEQALRKRFEPIVKRRRQLWLAWRLSVWWCTSGFAALAAWGVYRYWGWLSPTAIAALGTVTGAVTILILYGSRRICPDYHAVARAIERQHPEARAMLLAAVEQEPRGPDGQLGYLQESVIAEALRHSTSHVWLRAVSAKKLALANFSCLASSVFLIVILLRVLPGAPLLFKTDRGAPAPRGYQISVSPGDTQVESGSPVVILARFAGRVPPEATLYIGPVGSEKQPIALAKNLEDPVFGGVIQDVACDTQYHIEYAGKRTRDYEIRTYECPTMERADANIVYPAYTNLPGRLIKDIRQISVVEGSKVALTFTLNKPVALAQLVGKDQDPLDLTIDGKYANIYTTSITPTENKRYELRLVDAEGRANKVPPRFVIDVHKNLPPSLKPLFPNRDIEASALEEVSLEAEVADDFGITGYGVSYALAGAASADLELGRPATAQSKEQIQHVLSLEDMNAQPGQLLTYYFWADDVGPDGQVRKTLSDMYFAEVRRFEEIFRESQSSQSEQEQTQQQDQQQQQEGRRAEQLARLQKQIISATWNIKRQADQSGKVREPNDLEVVRQSQADALTQAQSALTEAEDPPSAQALQAAAEHMQTSLERLGEAAQTASAAELTPALAAEQAAYQELLKLRQSERQIGRSQSSSQSVGASARSEQQLQQLELKQQQDRYETERLAQSQEQTAQREDLQALNRLGELARRQNEMSEKLRELEAELRRAQNEQKQQEIARELKRLREQQLESLRDVDELQERMERPENRGRMADAREQLRQSRSRIQRSAEELEQGMIPQAITSATRAGRELEQMRDEFRRRTSGEFTERMRDMREQARQLDRDQNQISDDLKRQIESAQRLLSDAGGNAELAERIDRQKEKAEELIDRMKNVSEEAETSEPLLSKRLYDTVRQASTDNLGSALEVAAELLRRDFRPQAGEVEQHAREGIEQLKEGVEEAAASVLGNEAESLRLAQRQLDELIRQVSDEMARAGAAGRRSPGDANEPALAAADSAQSPGEQPGRQENLSQSPGGDATELSNPTGFGGGERVADQDEGSETAGPLTGSEFRQWSDRTRDVEEMLSQPVERSEIARVRDRARAIRAEFKRHGAEPKWDLVEREIIKPLTELQKRLSDELAKLQSDEAMVPIDRDPVSDRFAEPVRRYFENLGGGD